MKLPYLTKEEIKKRFLEDKPLFGNEETVYEANKKDNTKKDKKNDKN